MTAVVSIALGLAVMAIAVVDMRRYVIPDVISLPLIPAGLVATGFLAESGQQGSAMLAHVGAAVVGAAALYAIRILYQAWRGQEGLGLGDVKLGAVAGAWTGLDGIGTVLLLACVSALACVLVAYRGELESLQRTTAIPFGAFLAPAIWLVWCAAQTDLRFGL